MGLDYLQLLEPERFEIDEEAGTANYPGGSFSDGDIISLDGVTGNVYVGDIEKVEPEISGDFAEYLEIADRYRTMQIRTNADTPKMAQDALNNGAQGIGLCQYRTNV